MRALLIFLILFFGISHLPAQDDNKTLDEVKQAVVDLYMSGQYKEALINARKSLDICNQQGLHDSIKTESLALITDVLIVLREFPEAIGLVNQQKSIIKKLYGAEHPSYAEVLDLEGSIYYALQQFEEAADVFLKALNIVRNNKQAGQDYFAEILNNLGVCHEALGHYQEATAYTEEALEIIKKTGDTKNNLYAAGLTNYAGLLAKQPNKVKEATLAYENALALWEELTGKMHPNYAITVGNLAHFCTNNKQLEKAERYLNEALALKLQLIGDQHPDYLYDLSKLAHLYNKKGDKNAAIEVTTDLIERVKNNTGVQNEFYLGCLNNLILYSIDDHGDNTKALDLIMQSLQINLQLPKKPTANEELLALLEAPEFVLSDKEYSNTQAHLYRIFKAENPEWAKQFSYNNVRYFSQAKNQVSRKEDQIPLMKATALAAEETIEAAYQLIQNKAKNEAALLDFSFELSEYNKSMLLQTAIRGKDAIQFGNLPDSLVQQELYYQEELSYLKSQLMGNGSENDKINLQQAFNKIHEQQDKFLAALADNFPEYYQFKYQFIPTTISKIQEKLTANQAFIQYVVGEGKTFLFYISKNKKQLFRLSHDLQSLAPHIKDLHKALSNYSFINKKTAEAEQLFTKEAHFLYKELLAPALALEQHIDHLIIVTDGHLGQLPFEVFLRNEGGAGSYKDYPYLLLDYSISYHYSATLWAQQSPPQPNNGTMLAMSGTYDAEKDVAFAEQNRSLQMKKLRKVLMDLPNAKTEVQALEKNFAGSFYFDKSTTEAQFKASAAKHSVIHLAMHGILNPKQAILSSLVFSEDGDSTQDNFLQAWEISQMQLNADLVVLSACETGYGKFEQGEGIISLARSFMYAGVPSLVVSLWQVNDFATAEIMKAFYTNLSEGMNKATALRKAKLNFLSKASGMAAHPAFWSPFIQIGESKSILISKKGTKTPWFIGGGTILLLLTGLFLFRRAKEQR